jgi:hypothetical protein
MDSIGYLIGGAAMCVVVLAVGVVALLASQDALGIAASVLMILVGGGGMVDVYRRVRARSN